MYSEFFYLKSLLKIVFLKKILFLLFVFHKKTNKLNPSKLYFTHRIPELMNRNCVY